MKKFLSLLSLAPIATFSTLAIISCGEISKQNDSQFFKIKNDSKDINQNVVENIENNLRDYINEFTETQALKEIHIFDYSNYPTPFIEDEGDYVLNSNEIIINTHILSKYTNFTDEDKANYLMQLIAHEYNHYVDHSYLLGINNESSKADLSIHDWSNAGKIQAWPSKFLNVFKDDLNYTEDTELYENTEVAPGFKSLGSVYNQKNLFDMANGSKDPKTLYQNLSGDEVMSPINPNSEIIINNSRVIKSSALSYLYSMDELFARKMQISTSIYKATSSFDNNGFFENAYGEKIASPYLQDVINYQRGLNDFDDKGLYLNDKPTEELKDLYDEARGVDFAPISFMEVKNNLHILSDGSLDGKVDRNAIHFGGALDKDNLKLEYLGYMNGNNFVNIPIEIMNRSDNGGAKRSYLTNFIHASDIIDKTLYFAEDSHGKNKTQISSTRDIDFGLVTTHRYLDDPNDKNYSFNANAKLQTL